MHFVFAKKWLGYIVHFSPCRIYLWFKTSWMLKWIKIFIVQCTFCVTFCLTFCRDLMFLELTNTWNRLAEIDIYLEWIPYFHENSAMLYQNYETWKYLSNLNINVVTCIFKSHLICSKLVWVGDYSIRHSLSLEYLFSITWHYTCNLKKAYTPFRKYFSVSKIVSKFGKFSLENDWKTCAISS